MASETYPDLHYVPNLDKATEEDLKQIIRTFPIIDNHAHNMLLDDYAYGNQETPFECITSEAQGPALTDHVHTSLAHMRGMKQLSELYDCPPALADIKAARYEWVRRDYPSLIKKCVEGTHAIMMDDGLSADNIYPYKWHRQFVPTVSRIVRIEAIAAELLEQVALAAGFMRPGVDADWTIQQTEAYMYRFNTVFRNHIRTLANDPDVRGFKSVVCYRSGLDIGLEAHKLFKPHVTMSDSPLLPAFHEFLQHAVRDHKYRVDRKEVNDYLVVAVCDVLDKLVETEGESLPFQFHTGLGDTDIDLVKSNPAYMQPLVELFPNVDFVLLHSSYPYTREAGYMAANYLNVWLDIGEAFPMLSREGEESVLRQALELTPSSKILWSTDGHFYPESYWLANRQFRETLEKVLTLYVAHGDMTITQAITIAVDIMFWNSNTLYKLDEERSYPELIQACGRATADSQRTLINGHSKTTSIVSFATDQASTLGDQRPSSVVSPLSNTTINPSSAIQRAAESAELPTNMATAGQQNLEFFNSFVEKNKGVKYIWVQFCDYTGTLRQRMVPVAQFRKQIESGNNGYITSALTRLMQNDYPATGCIATGQFLLAPDLSTLCMNKGIDSPSASIQTWWMEDTEDNPDHYSRCPRWRLQHQVEALREYNINILMGFEVEVVFVRPVLNSNKSDYEEFEPLHMVHSWSNMTHQQLDLLPMVEEIVDTLAEIDIHVTQFHSEAAPGQWEFPLPPSDPVKAVDVLFKTKDTIRHIARKHGLKATMYPRMYDFAPGSACHAHYSINGPGDTQNRYTEPFLAGVLEHLPAILAFTLPLEESYARVAPSIWAGGEYVTWGTQNKEVPLRKCGPGHYEFKPIDGIGNAYLSMGALLAAGLHGVKMDMPLSHGDCLLDPSSISDEQRKELGITHLLPHTQEEALKELEGDAYLVESVGKEAVADYLAVKRSESEQLRGFGEKKRRVWLMSRY